MSPAWALRSRLRRIKSADAGVVARVSTTPMSIVTAKPSLDGGRSALLGTMPTGTADQTKSRHKSSSYGVRPTKRVARAAELPQWIIRRTGSDGFQDLSRSVATGRELRPRTEIVVGDVDNAVAVDVEEDMPEYYSVKPR